MATPHKCFCYPPELANESANRYRRYLKTAEEAVAEIPTAIAEMDLRVDTVLKQIAEDALYDAEFNLNLGKEDVYKVLYHHKKRLEKLAVLLKAEHEKVRSKAAYVCSNYNVSHVCNANEALGRIELRHHMSKFT